jgi:hypothetical protein
MDVATLSHFYDRFFLIDPPGGQKNTCSSSAIKRTSYFAHYGYHINLAQT